jgi:hypothetical protein
MKVTITAHPNSKHPRIEKDSKEVIHVYVNASPFRGKANKEIIEALANYFGTKKGKVFLVKGANSKNKVFEID